ncbi:hypothetical protein [Halalkalicoccus sp. NIPERK01]|uniref:hypothetical protein n=1 Tax=Halalkalicoccus sp. NIPERK01 TaxID=3053469 RepID=UPI00256F17B4|nr:hypothetical protein [Halalkalicoccus sp. NIPERK01]MDL5363904.1 hypothetical protein [Halalkalicoccus sp. NIPERK01]
MSTTSPFKAIWNLVAYLVCAWAIVIVSLGSYAAVRPWLIENTVNHYAIYAIWLLTTVGVLYVVSTWY